MQTQRKFISRFSPNRTAPEDLERINVQREDLLARSVGVLRESVLTENKHHLLFIGPRGSGKSHLLALIAHRLQGQPDLADALRLAWLNEDETSTSFLDLLLRIYRALAERYPAEFPPGDIERLSGRDRAEALDLLCQTLVSRAVRRTILVMLENLDTLFSQLDEPDQRAWRALIQNHPVFATVATAQSLFAGVSERDEPFFGFFDTTHLQPFTIQEAAELLQRIAQLNQDTALAEFLATARGRARVQAIHHLSGGNPRLYIVLSEFISCQSLDDLVRPFEGMVDEQLTPYYQERLRWLSPQQRKIVEFLCLRGRPTPVKEIAAALFAEQTSIAGQLLKLREMGYVKPNARGRESLYELAEPLMRLSMEVKSTRDHQPLRLIVDFLRVWYEPEEIEERLAKMGATDFAREYFSAALDKLRPGEPNLRHELLREGLQAVQLKQCSDEEFDTLGALATESADPVDWARYAVAWYYRGNFSAAIKVLTRAIESHQLPPETAAVALYLRGMSFWRTGQASEAADDCTKLVKLPGAPTKYVSWGLTARAGIRLAMGRRQDAIGDFTLVVEREGVSAEDGAWALYNRGNLFQQDGRSREAISDYTRLIERPNVPVYEFAASLLNRGWVYWQMGEVHKANADFTRLIELRNAPPDQLANALLNRSAVYAHLGRTQEALADATHATQMPDASVDFVVGAYHNRALILAWMGRTAEAIADYTRALEWPGAPVDKVAGALNNRGVELAQAGRMQDAISDWTRAIELERAPSEPVAMALNNRGLALSQSGHASGAIADFEHLIRLPDAPAVQVAKARAKLAESLLRLDRWDAGIEHLGDCLKQKAASSAEQVGDTVLDSIFRHAGSPEIWQGRLAVAAALYNEHGGIAYLGDALVRHLAKLAKCHLSSGGLDQWLAGWESACSGQSAMQLPLRLLRAGIAYLKTEPRDEGVLLQLPSEERGLVRQALGLETEHPK